MRDNCLQANHCDACHCTDSRSAVRRFGELWSAAYGPHEQPFPSGIPTDLRGTLEDDICSLSSNCSKRDVSKAASKFLFRKALPAPMKSSLVSDYFEKLGRDPLKVEEGFLDLSSRMINDLFPKGWDYNYEDYVRESVISSGASTEFSRKKGGAREYMRRNVGLTGFEEACLLGSGVNFINDLRSVHVLLDNGKPRIVTVASGEQHYLSPLHHMMYDRLTKHGAVLKGDANPKAFVGLMRDYSKKDDIYVSGDYSSATDNFNVGHSRILLRLIAQNSTTVPKGLWDVAVDSLSGSIVFSPEAWDPPEWEKSVGYQLCGQMMGNYLSFVLLCITNLSTIYRAFGYERARKMVELGLVVINGDDIVFRCTRAEYDTWALGVRECGLVLSPGKTLTHKRVFSLNSTFFVATDKSIRMIPVIRCKSIIREDKEFSPASFTGGLQALLRGWSGEARSRLAGCALRLRGVEWGVIGNKGGHWGSLCRLLRNVPVSLSALKKSSRQMIRREEDTFQNTLGFPAFGETVDREYGKLSGTAEIFHEDVKSYLREMDVEPAERRWDWLFETRSYPKKFFGHEDKEIIGRVNNRAGKLRTWIQGPRSKKDQKRERNCHLRYFKDSKRKIFHAGVISPSMNGEWSKSAANRGWIEVVADRCEGYGVDFHSMACENTATFRSNYLKYRGFPSFGRVFEGRSEGLGNISGQVVGSECVSGPVGVLKSVRRPVQFLPGGTIGSTFAS
ncbi:RNA-dependent RNA polymerase [Armillaria mellea ourmia-like virus 2]|uniref:RNA-dependent RNA polymerase n=1 Tax=Armillaria mellea ourmia-like virus 2 TaxID=2827438 RepID=A0ABX7YI29_9VIRU|nr:RNA-dependent RNA polymerase [Armillaria mellea ourmia-like virus 2]QUD20356.1 RNA-dependent RNA polymerase [Armillaria mellea ourmia-like virus 2]